MLTPLIVGRWDGNHVWLQWTPTPEKSYALRLRYLRPGKNDWTKWINTNWPWPFANYFLRIPTHAQGTMVQAQVAVFTPGMEDEQLPWEMAQSRRFGMCEADFEFTAERKVTFRKFDVFSSMVDSDVAAYQLLDDLEVPGGGTPVVARMRSTRKSGNNQLDYPGHLSFRPRPGVTLRNLTASEADLEEIAGDSVMIDFEPNEGRTVLMLGAVNQPRT